MRLHQETVLTQYAPSIKQKIVGWKILTLLLNLLHLMVTFAEVLIAVAQTSVCF